MFCKNCGTSIASNSQFCSKCGTSISAEISQPVAQMPIYQPNNQTYLKNWPLRILITLGVIELLFVIFGAILNSAIIIQFVNVILGLFFLGSILWFIVGLILGTKQMSEASQMQLSDDSSRLKTIGIWHIVSPIIFFVSIILAYVIVQVISKTLASTY